MQRNSGTSAQKYLIVSLLLVVGIWTSSNMLGNVVAKFVNDFTYIPLTILLAVTSLFQIYQVRKEHNSILMWSIFFVFAMAYTIAQHIWSLNEIILDQKPFPSLADAAYITFAIGLILFFMLLIKSQKQFIVKWMFLTSIPCSVFVITLSTHLFISNHTGLTLDQILSITYPTLDAIALSPALIGVMMYFKNKLDHSIFLICISMIPLTIGDILFQISAINGTVRSGDIPDLLYWIQITLLIFGVYITSNRKISPVVGMNQN